MKKLSNNLKKVLSFTLPALTLLILFGVSAIVVIISQGKKITDDGVIETSIIRVNVFPKDVKAQLDGKDVGVNENRIENVLPGTHTVKLTKNGYIAWEKEIILEPGIVKDIYAQLYPETIKFETITKSNVDNVFYSNDSDYIFYTILKSKTPAENGIWKLKLSRNLLDFSENKPFQIAKFDSVTIEQINKAINYGLKISDDDNKVIFTIGKEIGYIYDANQLNVKFDLNERLGFVPNTIQWLRNADSLLIIKDNLVFEYDINSNQSILINYNTEEKAIYGDGLNVVYYVKANKLYKYSNKITSQVILPPKATALITKIQSVSTPRYNSNILVIGSNEGLLYIDLDKNYVDLIDIKGSIISMPTNGKSLIYQNEDALYSYNLEETIDNKSYKSSIYNLGIKLSDVENIYFSPSSKNIIVMKKSKDAGKDLVIMDFDGTNKRNLIEDFTKVGNATLISKDSSQLYSLIREKTVDNDVSNNIYKFSLESK